jgi:TRAP-type C4-dicarboxylate transport system substrate-binding protein
MRSTQFYAIAIKIGISMLKALVRCALLAFALLPAMAAAEPIALKFSYYSSDREIVYLSAVKPFIDSVNTAANGLIQIYPFTSGSLGKSYAGQAQLVLDSGADFAFINPGLTPEQFPDDAVMELPGLFRDVREASIVYTRLVASGALRGYGDFFVVGALAGGPQSLHTRSPVASLGDLQGKKIRASNRTEGVVLDALGMSAAVLPINATADAISRGDIDGATVPPSMLVNFGISRVTGYHYLLHLGFAPLVVVMNKKKFDSLPKAAQDIIRKYSGDGFAMHFADTFMANDDRVLEQLKSDPKRTVIFPSQGDVDAAQAIFRTVTDEWQAANPRNRQLLTTVEEEIAQLRSGN